jgi:hypothetical protein
LEFIRYWLAFDRIQFTDISFQPHLRKQNAVCTVLSPQSLKAPPLYLVLRLNHPLARYDASMHLIRDQGHRHSSRLEPSVPMLSTPCIDICTLQTALSRNLNVYNRIIPIPDTKATSKYKPAWNIPTLLECDGKPGTPALLDPLLEPPDPEPPVAEGPEVTVPCPLDPACEIKAKHSPLGAVP